MSNTQVKYRRKLIRHRVRHEISMRQAFDRVVKEFVKKFGSSPIIRRNEAFEFKGNKKLNRELSQIMGKFTTELYENTASSIKGAWNIGNDMNDEVVMYYFDDFKKVKAEQTAMMARNSEALTAFIGRKRNARTLSDRIWQVSNRLRDELEANLMIGISDGKSASGIAEQIQSYLKNPDTLVRRVRDPQGDLRLSKAAKKLQPGAGVYRSSFKNALRVARTETNAAYRMADHLRWQKQSFVIGFDVQLSYQHPRYDICDQLEGRYPKTFLFTGWHPQCFCNVVPVLMDKADFVRKLNGESVKVNRVTQLPNGMKKWLKTDGKAVLSKKNKPYFILDNQDMLR